MTGWGAVFEGTSTNGEWSFEEQELHINAKETLAVFWGLKCFCKDLQDVEIKCEIDNTTAVAYVITTEGIKFQNVTELLDKSGNSVKRDVCGCMQSTFLGWTMYLLTRLHD